MFKSGNLVMITELKETSNILHGFEIGSVGEIVELMSFNSCLVKDSKGNTNSVQSCQLRNVSPELHFNNSQISIENMRANSVLMQEFNPLYIDVTEAIDSNPKK